MTPDQFFQFAGSITLGLLILAIIAAFIYEYYSAKKK